MSGKVTKTVAPIDLKELLQSLKRDIFLSMNCVKIGKINSFDGTKKTAEIKIMFKRVLPDNTIKDYPLLINCPVFTLQGGGGSIKFPIAAGDDCLVLFSDRSIDIWLNTGSAAAPTDSRAHHLSDAIALVGLNSLQSGLAAYPASEAIMAYAGAFVALKGGKAAVQNASYDLLTALTNLVQGIQGAMASSYPITDTTGKIATAFTQLQGLLYKD